MKFISNITIFVKKSCLYVNPKGILEWSHFIAYLPIALIHYWILIKKDDRLIDHPID